MSTAVYDVAIDCMNNINKFSRRVDKGFKL